MNAFNEAHRNMDQIRMMSSNVQNHLKAAMKFLRQGDNQVRDDILPVPLFAIKNTADKCSILAFSIGNQFGNSEFNC